MSTEPASLPSVVPPRSSSSLWFHARALWAGISIATMWLAVLFVGVFGEDIVSSTPGGTSTSVPVVVILLPFVLPATIAVARRGFTEAPGSRQSEVDDGRSTDRLLRSTRQAG
jgi:hypothetical protein